MILSSPIRAQESPWEIAINYPSFNAYYQENFNNPIDGDPEDVKGNAWDALQIQPIVTYRAGKDLGIPFFIALEAQVPLVTVKRLEIGDEYEPAGITDLTQKEQVAHKDFAGRALVGWAMLSYIQPYFGIVRSKFSSERTGQLNGDEEGNLIPDANQDYTETVYSTHICFGLQGTVPINDRGDMRIRYDASYEVPEAVFVSNDYFGPGAWGQGTTGYTIGGRVQLDLPFRMLNVFENPNSYFTIGGLIQDRKWNGNGSSGTTWYQEYPITVTWPQNFAVEAGGFLGVGMFF